MARYNRSRSNKTRKGRGQRAASSAMARTPITTLKFRETLMTINGTSGGDFLQSSLIIPTAFTWLRTHAATFSQFRLAKCTYHFIPAGSMTYTGTVVGGFTYDTYENPPSTFTQVAQLSAHTIGSIHRPRSWTLNTSRLGKQYWPVISPTALLALDAGARLPYLPAVFYIASDSANTQPIGKLEVQYTFEFLNPLFPEAGQNTQVIGFEPQSPKDEDYEHGKLHWTACPKRYRDECKYHREN